MMDFKKETPFWVLQIEVAAQDLLDETYNTINEIALQKGQAEGDITGRAQMLLTSLHAFCDQVGFPKKLIVYKEDSPQYKPLSLAKEVLPALSQGVDPKAKDIAPLLSSIASVGVKVVAAEGGNAYEIFETHFRPDS